MIKIGKIVNKITFAVSLISYGGVLAIMLLNVVDVFMTKAFVKPVTGAYEITEVLLLCTVMASFAYAQSQKTHINITMFVKHLPRSVKFSIYGFMGVISAGVAGAVGYAAVLQALSASDRGAVTSVLLIPLYPFYYVEAIAMAIFAVVLLYDAALAFAAIFNRKYEEAVTTDWT
jgi:TRAP-type C4-dicarboxylate transport system permease small subunit